MTHNWMALQNYGCYLAVVPGPEHRNNGTLLCAAMLEDGDMEQGEDAIIEVTNLDDDEVQLEMINHLMGTTFIMSDFPGR